MRADRLAPQKAGFTDPVIEDKHAAALENHLQASDASNSGKDFSFGSDEVLPEVKDMSTGHAISAGRGASCSHLAKSHAAHSPPSTFASA